MVGIGVEGQLDLRIIACEVRSFDDKPFYEQELSSHFTHSSKLPFKYGNV